MPPIGRFHSERLKALGLAAVAGWLCAGLLFGCSQSRSTSTTAAPAEPDTSPVAQPVPPQAVEPRQLPAPPLMGNRLGPVTEELEQRQNLELARVVMQLPVPDYLEEAGINARQDTEDAPTQAVKHYIEARDLLHTGKPLDAVAKLRQVIQADPKSAEAFRLLGQLYLRSNDNDLASVYFRQAVRADANDSTSLFQLGRIAMSDDEFDQAIAALNGSLERMNNLSDPGLRYLAHYYLGKCLMRRGYSRAAMRQYELFLHVPERFNRHTRYHRAVLLLARHKSSVELEVADAQVRLGQYDQAWQRYASLADDPDINRNALLVRRVYLALVLRRDDQAIRMLSDEVDWKRFEPIMLRLADYCADHLPDRNALLERLQSTYRQQDYPERLAELLSQWMPAPRRRAFLAEHLDRHPEHMGIYRRQIEMLWPTDPRAVLALTIDRLNDRPALAADYLNVLLDQRDRRLAFPATLKKVSRKQRETAGGWYCRARAAQAVNDLPAAEHAYNAALDREPDFVAARWGLIELEIASGQYQQAQQMIQAVGVDSHPRVRLLLAVLYGEMQQWDQAATLLEALNRDDPTNPDYLNRRALLEMRRRDFDAAENAFLQALKVDPTNETAYAGLFSLYEQARPDAAKFRKLLQQVRALLPDSRLTRLKIAHYHVLRREYEQAEKLLSDMLAEYPGDGPTLSEYIELMLRQDRAHQAIEKLQARLDKQPNDTVALDLLRDATRRTFQTDLFFQRYETYLKQLPENFSRQARLAALYQEWDKPEQAVPILQALLETESDNQFEILIQLAQAQQEAKSPKQALASLERALAVRGDVVSLQIYRAQLLRESGQADKAVDHLKQLARRFTDDDQRIRQALAMLYLESDRLDDALRESDALLADYADDRASLHYFKSQLYVRADKQDLAEQSLRLSLEADPDNIHANNDLGYSLAERGEQLDRAEEMIRKAVRGEPSNPAYLDSLGWVYYKKGRFDQAVQWLTRAIRLPGGDDPTVLDHLGDALWRQGNTRQAIEKWRIARKLLDRQTEDYTLSVYRKLDAALKAKFAALRDDQPPPIAPVVESGPAPQPQAVDR